MLQTGLHRNGKGDKRNSKIYYEQLSMVVTIKRLYFLLKYAARNPSMVLVHINPGFFPSNMVTILITGFEQINLNIML